MLLRGGYIYPSWWWHRPAWCCWRNTASPCPGHQCARRLGQPYVLGLLVCFMLNAILVVVFITRISHNLRRRDARLAAAPAGGRRRTHRAHGAAGIGRAHELGTPLATLAVILGDWKRIPALTQDPVLLGRNCRDGSPGQALQDHRQRHPDVCRRARGESSSQTTVRQFLDTLVQNWRATRSVDTFVYDNLLEGDSPMVADATWSKWFSMCWTMPGMHRRTGCACRRSAMPMRCESWSPTGAPAFGRRAPPHRTPYQSFKGRPGAAWGCSCR